MDVWEHAYYIDYRNLRPKFVETFLNKSGELEVCQKPTSLLNALTTVNCHRRS